MINLNSRQAEILATMLNGENVFVTGAANTGKTALLKEFCKNADSTIVCSRSPLGTLEILDKIVTDPFRDFFSADDSKAVPFEIKVAKTIVIDDIQNFKTEEFETIISVIRRAEAEAARDLRYSRNSDIPLCAKKQIIIAGDFFQTPFFCEALIFESESWKYLKLNTCILTHNVCGISKQFVLSLDAVRIGNSKGLKWILDHGSYYRMKKSIYIYNGSKDAKYRNEQKLNALQTAGTCFKARDHPGENYNNICSDTLELKPGAMVVALINSTVRNRYKRGDIGKVKEILDDTVIVQWENGKETCVERFRWSICEYKYIKGKGENHRKLIIKEIGCISQFPLKPAYAISVDEAKGMLFERAVITPEQDELHKLYIALSKMKQVDGLFLKTRNLKLEVSPTIIKYYDTIGFDIHIDHRGGSRAGSGRKSKFGATTTTTRVPVYLVPVISSLADFPVEEAVKIAQKWQEELQKLKNDKE